MSLAKEIRKEGEKWSDAVKRAGTQMKKGNTEIKKSTNTELKKLLALVKTRKELKGITGTNLKRDSKRKAKPLGKRVSEDGNVYYEYRDNRTDRLAPNYPKNAPLLAGGGSVDKVKIRDWYMKTYPTDELGKELDRNSTFEDVWTAINNGTEIYSVFGVGDSLIRERIFEKLSKIYKVDYNYVYKKWLDTDYYSDGGGVDYYEQLTVYVVGVGTLGSGTSMRKAIDKAREYEKKNPNAEVVIVDEKYGDEYDSDGNFKNEYATGGGVDNLPTNLKTRLKNLKGRVTISKAQALKAYELHNERGMGGSTIGYEMFDAKNKRDSETFGDLAIDLGRHYSKFADGGYNEGIEEDIDMTEDYVLKVNKGVQPENRASMKDWMAKTNESREAMAYELGGATMTYDLAGNTGGGTAGLNANMPLSGVSGTQYTDLVGETGALSSGEMFARGGGIRKVGNREYPLGRNWTNDHNQVNKSEEHETSYNRKGFFATGGGVDNVEHFPLDKKKLDEDAEWYADRIKSGKSTATKKSIIDSIEEHKKDLFLLEVGRKKPSNIIGTGYRGNTRKMANTWLLEQIYKDKKILELLENHSFADGGAVMANQQIIDDASQHYVNYYLNDGASAGMFKDGGAIKNQYAGRTPRDIWNSLSIRQRMHFLQDHEEEILEDKKLRYFTDNDLVELIHSDWVELDDDVKNAFADHTSRGEYAYGGKMHNYKQMEDNYARGGGIRTINGREYSTGRNWTNDHKHHNKMQDYEVPMSKRR